MSLEKNKEIKDNENSYVDKGVGQSSYEEKSRCLNNSDGRSSYEHSKLGDDGESTVLREYDEDVDIELSEDSDFIDFLDDFDDESISQMEFSKDLDVCKDLDDCNDLKDFSIPSKFPYPLMENDLNELALLGFFKDFTLIDMGVHDFIREVYFED